MGVTDKMWDALTTNEKSKTLFIENGP